MSDLDKISISRLRDIARENGIKGYNALNKRQLVEALDKVLVDDGPNYVYLADKNQWVLEGSLPSYSRVFDQKGQLNTSDELPIRLTKAYNMENLTAINDHQLKLGAKERGQKLGDASGGRHIKDEPPESE